MNDKARKKTLDLVTFNSDFPDDSVWDEQDNLLVPEGQTVAECLCQHLQKEDINCSDAFQYKFYGWAFEATYKQVKVHCILQIVEEWILIMEERKSIISSFFYPSSDEAFGYIQKAVHTILKENNKFSNVLWYSQNDYDNGGKERAYSEPL